MEESYTLAKIVEPFSCHGQELTTLVNYHLTEDSTIIGFVVVSMSLDIVSYDL